MHQELPSAIVPLEPAHLLLLLLLLPDCIDFPTSYGSCQLLAAALNGTCI
jgi:hypothetical protein